MKNILLLLVGLSILIPQYAMSTSQFSPKYRLNECIVQVKYKWNQGAEVSEMISVIEGASEALKEEGLSGRYPLFSSSYVRGTESLLLFFSDNCPDRKQMAIDLIRSVKSKIESFPNYSIKASNIQLEEHGVLPSGWWIDD